MSYIYIYMYIYIYIYVYIKLKHIIVPVPENHFHNDLIDLKPSVGDAGAANLVLNTRPASQLGKSLSGDN